MILLIATIFKEFLQLVRNRVLLFLVFACPIILLGVIPLSFDGSTRFRAGVCDMEGGYQTQKKLIELSNNRLFESVDYFVSLREAQREMDRGRLDLIVCFAPGGVQILLDGTFPRRALSSLYNTEQILFGEGEVPLVFQTLFNAGRRYNHFSLISLIVLVITLIGTALFTLNLVKERESGLEEQLRATTINRFIYFSGKFIFFVLLCLFEIVLCLLFCKLVYGLENQGSFADYLLVNLVFLFPLLGMGFVIASYSNTQLRAVYILTIVLILLIMLSSMFTHLSSMPQWAAATRFVNPVYYGIESSRMVIFKGASALDIAPLLGWMLLLGLLLNSVAFFRFRKA
jgi:ABC-2 type transport system permease protein